LKIADFSSFIFYGFNVILMKVYAQLMFLLRKSLGLQRKHPHPPCYAGGGAIRPFSATSHGLGYSFEAVRIRVKLATVPQFFS
jgi:hypothetical protein